MVQSANTPNIIFQRTSYGNVPLWVFVITLTVEALTTFRPEDVVIPKGATSSEKQILQPEHLITLFTVDTTVYYGKTVHDDLINAYRFSVLTGLRPGELIGLLPINYDGSAVMIKRSINVFGEETRGKNDNALRLQVLPPIAKKVMVS